MIIKSLPGFVGNGRLQGTLVALDDAGEPLGWEEYGNWSSGTFVKMAVASLAEDTGIEADQARKLIVDAKREARRLVGTEAADSPMVEPDGERARIVINGRHLRELAADSWAVISGSGDQPEFFVVGESLAHLEIARDRIYPRILRKEALIHHLDRLADYVTAKDGQFTPAFPPKNVAEDMLAMASPPVPPLQGVVNTPVVAPDGACITTEGYHPEVELYLDFKGLEMPAVPDRPLPSDVARARALLLDELLTDCPFVTPADKTHIVAAMLTPLVRPMIDGPTPLFLIEAPSPGTGKGLLVEIVVAVTTGGVPAVMTEGRGSEEWRKRLTAALVETPALLLIDNIQQSLDAAPLAAALTSQVWQDRELGSTRVLRLPVRCTWMATGNNVSLSAEMARRTVLSRIDSSVERPWERDRFKHDPLMPWVHRNRGELCWSLLTLVRAWVAKGRPEPKPRMGSFDEWVRIVGGILETAEIPGFLENRSMVYAQADAESEVWAAFMDVWWERFGANRVGVNDLHDLARESRHLADLRGGRSDRGARTALGMSLASMRDRRVGDYWIRSMGKGHGGLLTFSLQISFEMADRSIQGPPGPPQNLQKSTFDGEDGGPWVDLETKVHHESRHEATPDGGPGGPCLGSIANSENEFYEISCVCNDPNVWENGAALPPCTVCGSRSWCLDCHGCIGCRVFAEIDL